MRKLDAEASSKRQQASVSGLLPRECNQSFLASSSRCHCSSSTCLTARPPNPYRQDPCAPGCSGPGCFGGLHGPSGLQPFTGTAGGGHLAVAGFRKGDSSVHCVLTGLGSSEVKGWWHLTPILRLVWLISRAGCTCSSGGVTRRGRRKLPPAPSPPAR